MEIYQCIPLNSIIKFDLPADKNCIIRITGQIVEHVSNYKYKIKDINARNTYYFNYKSDWLVINNITTGCYVITDQYVNGRTIEGKVTYVKDLICRIENIYGDEKFDLKINPEWKTIYPNDMGKILINKRIEEYNKYKVDTESSNNSEDSMDITFTDTYI